MKRILAVALLLSTILACSTARSGGTSTPGHGAVSIQIVPNPVVAKRVSGNEYDFPFEVVVRETGGRGVTISRVTADVYALGGIQVATETYNETQIRALGYSTNIPGNGELRYRFTPRKSVPNEGLFNGVSAKIRVDAYDDTNTPASATTVVTVTR